MAPNECTYLVNRQLKKDRIEQCKASKFKQAQVTSPKMVVIVRKHEIKADLVRFFYAALFSPVKATLIRPLKNKQI